MPIPHFGEVNFVVLLHISSNLTAPSNMYSIRHGLFFVCFPLPPSFKMKNRLHAGNETYGVRTFDSVYSVRILLFVVNRIDLNISVTKAIQWKSVRKAALGPEKPARMSIILLYLVAIYCKISKIGSRESCSYRDSALISHALITDVIIKPELWTISS